MDSGDPTALLLTRIRSLEPDYAPKIIGYLLLQDFHEKDLMHLALGPESLLHSIISKVKTQLGLFSNTLSAPSTNGRVVVGGGGGLSHSNGFMGVSNQINGVSATTDLLDDQQLNGCLSFLDDSCSETEDDNVETHLHSRSFSADNVDGDVTVTDSHMKGEDFVRQEEMMMRLKMAAFHQRQRLLLGRVPQLPYEKGMDFLLHQHALRYIIRFFGSLFFWLVYSKY